MTGFSHITYFLEYFYTTNITPFSNLHIQFNYPIKAAFSCNFVTKQLNRLNIIDILYFQFQKLKPALKYDTNELIHVIVKSQ